jgi:hypothetical protein
LCSFLIFPLIWKYRVKLIHIKKTFHKSLSVLWVCSSTFMFLLVHPLINPSIHPVNQSLTNPTYLPTFENFVIQNIQLYVNIKSVTIKENFKNNWIRYRFTVFFMTNQLTELMEVLLEKLTVA